MSEPTPQWGSADGGAADAEERKRVRLRLEAQRSFRVHALVYLILNVAFIGIWAATGADYFWPVWTILGWGIGLAFHAFGAYGPVQKPITDADVDAEIRRRRDRRPPS